MLWRKYITKNWQINYHKMSIPLNQFSFSASLEISNIWFTNPLFVHKNIEIMSSKKLCDLINSFHNKILLYTTITKFTINSFQELRMRTGTSKVINNCITQTSVEFCEKLFRKISLPWLIKIWLTMTGLLFLVFLQLCFSQWN